MFRLRHLVLILALMTAAAPQAVATPLVAAPLPHNAYITMKRLRVGVDLCGGLRRVVRRSGPDFSVQGPLGWRLPTAHELLLAPTAADFLFPGANVPLGGGDPVSGAYFAYPTPTLTGNAACAAAYFVDQPFENHCDWANAPGAGPGTPIPRNIPGGDSPAP